MVDASQRGRSFASRLSVRGCIGETRCIEPANRRELMNRYEPLHATSDLSVSRFDHPPHEAHEDPDEEIGTQSRPLSTRHSQRIVRF